MKHRSIRSVGRLPAPPIPPVSYASPTAIDRLHRWRHGELADDRPTRPWNRFELEWYARVRAENEARRQELFERGEAMNGRPTQVMPEPMRRP